jgi:hypothetical protein
MQILSESQATLVRLANIENRGGWDSGKVRYWGTEIEHPRAGQFLGKLIENEIYETKTDPTVAEAMEPNQCQCNQCAHDCNCNQCAYRRNRCSASTHNEIALAPCRLPNPRGFADYCEQLTETPKDYANFWCESCEYDSEEEYCHNCGDDGYTIEQEQNWGFHTHIDARDLTLRQVASVVRLGTYAMKQWANAFGADIDTYNSHASEQEIERNAEGDWGERPSVNATPILNYIRRYHEADRQDPADYPNTSAKATIEFRSFRATDNGVLHLSRVATARAMVDYVASGKPLFWLLRETDFEKFLTELEIWNH